MKSQKYLDIASQCVRVLENAKSIAIRISCFMALVGVTMLHSVAHGAEQREIIIAAGSKGGTYFPMGQLFADFLSTRIPGLSVKVLETSGGVENINLIADGKATFGFVNAATAWDAASGQPAFKGRVVPVRAVAAISPNIMHIIARDDAKINSVSDLGGHRVSVGAPNSGTQVIADRIFAVYNLDESPATKKITLGLKESIAALESGSIDAFFFGAALPVSAIEQMSVNKKVKIKLIDNADTVKRLNQYFGPMYREGKIPLKTYSGQAKEITALEVWDLLVTLESTNGKLVYDIAKALFENKAELASRMKNLDRLDPQTQNKNGVISLHPGSQRALAEKGIQPFARQLGF